MFIHFHTYDVLIFLKIKWIYILIIKMHINFFVYILNAYI
jgi:hypothetical protein